MKKLILSSVFYTSMYACACVLTDTGTHAKISRESGRAFLPGWRTEFAKRVQP